MLAELAPDFVFARQPHHTPPIHVKSEFIQMFFLCKTNVVYLDKISSIMRIYEKALP